MLRLFLFVIVLCVTCVGNGRDVYAQDACYDVAVVGRIVDARGFVPLDQLDGADPHGIYLGGRIDLRVRVSRVLAGDDVSRTLDVRAVMTSLPTRQATLIFYLKRRDQSPYQAIDWDFAERDVRGRYSARGDEAVPARCV